MSKKTIGLVGSIGCGKCVMSGVNLFFRLHLIALKCMVLNFHKKIPHFWQYLH